MKHNIRCIECGLEFTHWMPTTKYCSKNCKQSVQDKKWGRKAFIKISTATVGAISEMAVSVDLMSKGYSVFRALSGQCECDLIAIYKKKIYRIEVRTGYMGYTEKICYPKHERDTGRSDLYAIYIRSTQKIFYFSPVGEPIEMPSAETLKTLEN